MAPILKLHRLALPSKPPFEPVDWARYKDAVPSSPAVRIDGGGSIRTSRVLNAPYAKLDLGNSEDRRLIPAVQRTIHAHPERSRRLAGGEIAFFETVVLEIASLLKSKGINPENPGFEASILAYARATITDLEAAERALFELLPNLPPATRAIYDALAGKSEGGEIN